MSRGYVWVVDDDSFICWVMEKMFFLVYIKCEIFVDVESVLLVLECEIFDVFVLDICMLGMDGIVLFN